MSELDDVVVVGEVAYTLARDSLSVTPRSDGEATTVSGHRLRIYRKQSEGAGCWRATSTRWSPARNEGAVRSGLARSTFDPSTFRPLDPSRSLAEGRPHPPLQLDRRLLQRVVVVLEAALELPEQ